MEAKYLLGFDVGTYESKGVICDFQGEIIAQAFSKHVLKSPQPGWAEHDPINDWWVDFKKVVAELLEKAGISSREIAAIGISAIMAAITPVDEDFNPLRNAILYGIDTRCVPQAEALNAKIDPETLKKFGGPCTVEHYGPKILWIKENEPEVFAKTKQFTIASGFLTGKLTGVNYLDKYSAKSGVPLITQDTIQWDDTMCELVCPKSMLPVIAQSTYSVIGNVTKKAAEETGLWEGTPVICGTTDAGAEAVSVGVIEPGDTMLMYGSTAFWVSVAEAAVVEDLDVFYDNYTIDDLYCFAGGMATTGSLTRWILDNLAPDLVEREKKGEGNAYTMLFSEAADIPLGSDGLVCLPYFSGERMPIQDPNAKGVYFGLNLRHKRGHLIRAALEGIACGLEQNISQLRRNGVNIQTVTAVGGGTKSPLWLQIVSDVCNIRQVVPEVTVGASYGDALMAGLGIGAIKSPADIKKLVKVKYVIEPNPGNYEAYGPCREIFKELYIRNKDLMHRL